MRNYCMNCMAALEEPGLPCPHCGYTGDGGEIPHQLRPGTLLSRRYLVGTAIGQGGFGITYIGRDTRLDMKIAIKEYYPAGYANRNTQVSSDITITDKEQRLFIEEGKKKFIQEARTLALFNDNAGIVNVRDFFEANQTAYIIMEYLSGEDLRRCLKRSLFTPNQIFALMAPIFDALEKIHGENMIHRDISPDNIMMLSNGTLKLMDFGAVRQLNSADPKSVSVVLKAGFAPEEQYRSKGILGPWTDIYALCATIYKCITGITPDDSLQRGSKDELQWPSELGIPITARQEAVLKKGLAVKQEDRFQRVGEMMAALSGDADLIDLRAGGEPENDPTVNHLHTSWKNGDGEEKTEYYAHGGRGKGRTAGEEEEATERLPRDGRGKKPPSAGEEEAEDDAKRGQPESEGESGTDASNDKRKRGFFIAGICAAAILIALVVTAAVRGGSDRTRQPDPTVVPGADAAGETDAEDTAARPAGEADEETDSSSMYHVILTIDNEVTLREYNEALPVLTQRLEQLTGGEPYEMTVENDSIDLYLPKDVFGEVGIENAFKCYISRAIDLYIIDKTDAVYGTYLTMRKEPLRRDDLESVTLMEGTIDGIDAAQYGIDTPTYQYIAVTLSDSYAGRYGEKLAEWGENLAFAQDIDSAPTNYYYHETFPAGDGKTFYILTSDLDGYFPELLVHNLTHAPLPFSFGTTIDLNSRVEWQSPGDVPGPGENQREAAELTGDTVTFLLKYYGKNLTAGELLDLETEVKARLDTLEQPYAYGKIEDPGSYVLAVKTGLEHMGKPVMDLIGNYGWPYLGTSLVADSVDCESLTWEKDVSGNFTVTMKVGSYSVEKLARLSGWMAERGGGTLSLSYSRGGVPLLSAGIDREIEDGTLTFRQLCFDGGGDGANITEEDIWMLRLLDQVWNKSQFDKNLSVGDVQMDLDGKVASPVESRYGLSYAREAESVTSAVLSVAPNASVTIEGGQVNVSLGLAVNEDLPASAAATAAEIFEASGFEKSIYRYLNIYLIDEKDSERGRILFYKNHNLVSSGDNSITDGFVYANGIFMNGRLERYKDAFRNIVETDPFYVSMTVENWTDWLFDA